MGGRPGEGAAEVRRPGAESCAVSVDSSELLLQLKRRQFQTGTCSSETGEVRSLGSQTKGLAFKGR